MSCQGTTKLGRRCKRYANRGQDYCGNHLGQAKPKPKKVAPAAKSKPKKVAHAISPIAKELVPPEFSPPAPDPKYEGYWSEAYAPVPKKTKWEKKSNWLKMAYRVMYYLKSKEEDGKYLSYEGFAESVFDPDVCVGAGEYVGDTSRRGEQMSWPEGYVEYYIGVHNVMPTKRFYLYIIDEYQRLLEEGLFDVYPGDKAWRESNTCWRQWKSA